jgi:acetolactate synthase-1/2/3 large subunit
MTLSGERPGQHATTTAPTVADGLAEALRAVGVRRIFGVPGGGSSLDIIAAADARGLEFVLTQTETAAALMAAVTAELSGAPGVVVTGLGPGTASAVNGIAYAALERAPVLLISDVADDDPGLFSVHQRFDQGALLAPLCKRTVRLRGADAAATIAAALDAAMALPPGPVFLELSAREAARPLAGPLLAPEPSRRHDGPAEGDVAAARTLLARSQRPVIVAGLQARHAVAASALGRLLDELACPILTTYKAKGVVPDRDRRVIGHFTGGKAEADGVSRADLILFYGVDPVELVHHVWRYQAPLVELASVAGMPQPATPAATLVGPLAVSVERLRGIDRGSRWTPAEMASLLDRLRARLAIGAMNGHSPQAVVEATRAAAPAECRATVDSGAHMFSAMTYWQAERPFDVLKSNGLSTMGYALPAAIAAALEAPQRPVVAFTGDGGLMMCLSELATAARLGCPIVVVVFNDAALSLIDIKQQRQGRPSRGVRYPSVNLAGAAAALGCRAWRAAPHQALGPILDAAFAGPKPALVDVAVDPSGYADQLAALRG